MLSIQKLVMFSKITSQIGNKWAKYGVPMTCRSFSNTRTTQDLDSLLKFSASYEEPSNDKWATSVYPDSSKVVKTEDETEDFRLSPNYTTIFLFPGQGAQFVGMGQEILEFPNVKEMYKIAKKILGYDLLDVCLHGPKEELNKTEICQPAVFVTSLAAVEKVKVINPEAIDRCVGTAGFSVGEYAALVFAGVIKFEDALRLVHARGKAMQAASQIAPSGMMTVFLHPDAKIKYACKAAEAWCARHGISNPVCSVANYLFAGCKVISGNMEALKFIELNAKDFGIKRYKYLQVSGGFHTELMRPAADVVKKALETIEFGHPLVPLYMNVDGKRHTTSTHLKEALVKQVYKPVLWEQLLHSIYKRPEYVDEFPTTYECGPGSSIKAMLKIVNGKAWKKCSLINV